MNVKWLIGIVSAFVLMSVIAGVCENAYVTSEAISKIDVLMRPFVQTSAWSGITAFVGMVFSGEFWQTLWDILWWDYPFFDGSWGLVRYIFFIPLSLSFIISLGLAAIRGVSS